MDVLEQKPPSRIIAVMKCRACGLEDTCRMFGTREMLFGWRHPADYTECAHCGSLQIRRIPENLGDYYPPDYYSLQLPPLRSKKASWPRQIWARWLLSSLFAGGIVRWQRRKYPFFNWCRLAGIELDSKILDLGCGSGGLLRRMQRYGFSDLTGIDPYTPFEVNERGFQIRRAELADAGGGYDLMMLHHVLEHLPDPRRALEDARDRLGPRGKLLVRIPVSGSESCKIYGEHWFNLDPPRHLLVPSRDGMIALAERSGLRVVHTEFDGIETGFLMSELYRRDVPYTGRPADDPEKVRLFSQRAEAANARGEGDQGVFLLEKA